MSRKGCGLIENLGGDQGSAKRLVGRAALDRGMRATWCPFVGALAAKTSKWRVLRSSLMAMLFLPTLLAFWFGVRVLENIHVQRMAPVGCIASAGNLGNSATFTLEVKKVCSTCSSAQFLGFALE